jgi:small subunit ribosomal protein S10
MVKITSYEARRVVDAINQIKSAAININLDVKHASLPVKKKVYTVLRSPHIDKKSREQFELRRYARLISLISNDKNVFDDFLNQLKDQVNPGISLKIKFFSHEHI